MLSSSEKIKLSCLDNTYSLRLDELPFGPIPKLWSRLIIVRDLKGEMR